MITAWRITKEKWRSQAVTGEGAEITGGRWNKPGIPVVYASGAVSLAMLELLAGFSNPNPPGKYVLVGLHFDEKLIEIPSALPANWNKYPHSIQARKFGDLWANQERSVVLRVPSALVPSEWNYVINPRHRDFPKVLVDAPLPIELDPRLIPSARTR
jgi:RES domain-containing protein